MTPPPAPGETWILTTLTADPSPFHEHCAFVRDVRNGWVRYDIGGVPMQPMRTTAFRGIYRRESPMPHTPSHPPPHLFWLRVLAAAAFFVAGICSLLVGADASPEWGYTLEVASFLALGVGAGMLAADAWIGRMGRGV